MLSLIIATLMNLHKFLIPRVHLSPHDQSRQTLTATRILVLARARRRGGETLLFFADGTGEPPVRILPKSARPIRSKGKESAAGPLPGRTFLI